LLIAKFGGTDRNSADGSVSLVAIIHGRGERETHRWIAYRADYVHTAQTASPTQETLLHGAAMVSRIAFQAKRMMQMAPATRQ
jgi:hypothetical protein